MSNPSQWSLSGTRAKAASGTSSSPATTISATRRYPARRCDTSSGPLAANPSPFSASAPQPGRPRRGTSSWDPETRRRNLPLVVNNARALPWVRIKNLASHVLALVECRLPDDWEGRYALRPVLMETFCESMRFEGTCYQAANWARAGRTQGRGKLDVRNERALPVKDIWLKPLRRDWRRLLNK